jgi:predicted Ser/Thr protein kinase
MNVVMSTSSELHRHSRPYSNQSITDSGVAVYFTRKGRKQAIACDKWDSIRDNLQAVAKTIEACAGLNVGDRVMVNRSKASRQFQRRQPSK